jgi:hypothetical protein
MSGRTFVHSRWLRYAPAFLVLAVALLGVLPDAGAQDVVGFRNNAVGGISISTEGIVGPPKIDAHRMLLATLRKELGTPSAELTSPTSMRMVSLKALEAACEEALRDGDGELPEEVAYLAGLQRVQYIFVYPEENDIVLAGPGEGWTVNDRGTVVGVTSRRPVLRLDDLLVALRTVEAARLGGISCSIDPTAEGYNALRQVLDQQRTRRVNPPVLEAAMKQAFGPQQVTIQGVPATSHFARVLVAADYRMKRIAMRLDKAPIRGLPSYLDLIGQAGSRAAASVNPRWWLACNYEPLAASEDHLAWELRGPGVKAMTEDEVRGEDGEVRRTGRSSGVAQKWADLMTDNYSDLSERDSVFGELRNIMDLCVIAALLEKQRLWDAAGLSAPVLRDAGSELTLPIWNAPKAVPPEVSFLRTRNSWIVTASGGVQVESWQVASRFTVEADMQQLRNQATPRTTSLWWH